MQFSHLPADRVTSGDAPVSHMAHDNLFREPEFAPGTPRPEVDEADYTDRQPAVSARPRRTTRRRTAA